MIKQGVFFTVAYPQALPYLEDVCKSVISQSRKDFDFVVVNDGCEQSSIEKSFQGQPITIIDAVEGLAANRLLGIDYAKKNGYEYILFCDADDTFTFDRYERTIKAFEEYGADIVVSNLNIVDENLNNLIPNYFSKELPSSQWIEPWFIMTKNIFGMSNTAIRVRSVTESIHIPDIQIVDWYLYTVLLHRGLKAMYINEAMVNYRQYSNNMIGINRFDVASFKRLATHKYNHYRLLLENGYNQYQPLFQESRSLLTLRDDEIEYIVKQGIASHPQPLWWQIVSVSSNN